MSSYRCCNVNLEFCFCGTVVCCSFTPNLYRFFGDVEGMKIKKMNFITARARDKNMRITAHVFLFPATDSLHRIDRAT